ncbi:glycoside hydrolase family 78 protein [Gaoshiqia sediminis]|uniref:alpha-L-rhamnosidase n=1 Tax=Gaoshiqia sediminis TaxID=2986998 RepID=A0AA41YCW4_9BACT|nr:glycoside hydrolase family 78 protein [Gaoshiqia sediminis]MCW0484298.1 glycoside hydrolase family 78 protein [Gaoshiqia sediminis]
MKKTIFLAFAFQCLTSFIFAQISVSGLLVENKVNPVGISEMYPRLSWQLQSSKRNVTQSAFEIRVSEDLNSLLRGANLIFHTGKIPSDQSVYVQFTGSTLKPGRKYYWQVRAWDQNDKMSKWSEPAFWVMGIMGPENWTAKWIESTVREPENRPSPIFRKEFTTNKKVKLAVAFITARGMYEAEINGKRVGDICLAPGWTSYNKRLQYQTYDVTNLLLDGKNAVGVTLGNGWYRGNIGFDGQKNFYGENLSLLFQMQIIYTDGSVENVISDGSWRSSTGPIQYSEIYHGETYDARLEKAGWTMPGYNDTDWENIRLANYPVINLVATKNEPVRKREVFKPVKILTTPTGEKVIDFGQNLVGWVKMKASGNAGNQISIFHSEVLDKDGNFYTESLRSAKQKNTFILKGEGVEEFEPRFTWQGFRFIKVEGYPGELKAENFTATALYSDMVLTGTFSCSDDLVNKLQQNIQWGQRGNFVDVPTDCPQRDERLGWTGDAQAFARTASFNFRVHSFFNKWMKDVAADQYPDGGVPFVVPDVLNNGQCSPGWGDVATIAPWAMYLAYGDKPLLESQYESMKKWVDYIRSVSQNNLWSPKFSFGDWLFYRPFDDNSGLSAVTDKNLIAQCFFAHSTQLLINAARVLGNDADAEAYEALLQEIKSAFLHEYATASGRLVSGTQTAYVLALHFDMLPENMRVQAAQRLVENIRAYDTHLTTGFLGTPYLCHVLSRFGYNDVAYDLLLQKSYPSWLYPVTMGATTIWERWDGIKPDGSFQTPSMNSFNHYAYGAIGDWLYRVVTGIDTDEEQPGYKAIRIKPQVSNKLTHAKATLETYYGKVSSAWERIGGRLNLNVEIPVNTTATVYVPATDASKVKESGRSITGHKDLELVGSEEGYVIVKVGSGLWQFSAN